MNIIQKLQKILQNPNLSIGVKSHVTRLIPDIQLYFSNLEVKEKIQIDNYINLMTSNLVSNSIAKQCLAKISFILSAKKQKHIENFGDPNSPRFSKIKNIISNIKQCILQYEDMSDRRLATIALNAFHVSAGKLTESEVDRIYDLTKNSFIPRSSLIILLRICNKTQYR